jgi:hypothetical protein
MDELEAKEELRLIKEMIEKTKKSAVETGFAFMVAWGILIILAVIGNYVLVWVEKYSWIWLNWIVFPAIGVILSFIIGARLERKQGTKTYAQIAAAHLSLGCGIALIFTGLVFPALGLYSWGVISVLVATIWGILVFVIGGIFDWNLLKWCGVLWWLGAFGMLFIHENYRAAVFIPLILIGYLIPAFILRSKYQKS